MLVNAFPPVPAGGAERQAERLSEYLTTQGLRVSVVTRSAPGLLAHEQRNGYHIARIPQPGVGKLKTISFVIGAAISLIQRRHTYDILHAHLAFSPALVAAFAARLLGKRVIVKYGTSGMYGDVLVSQRTLRGRIRLALLRRWTDVSIALDAEMEQELLRAKFPRERVLRMDNGIEHTAFLNIRSAAAKQMLNLEGHTVVIYTGRLVPQKGLPMLLYALRKACDACPNLHLLLLGQGPERVLLEQQVQTLGLGSNVTFVGNVQDVVPYLSAADIFVLPSVGEGISNSLLEAMSSGLACIATTVGGSAEVLDNGACGMLVSPGNIEQLAQALTMLAQNPQEADRLGIAAAQRIQTRYAFTVVGEAYRQLYTNLSESTWKAKPREDLVGEQ